MDISFCIQERLGHAEHRPTFLSSCHNHVTGCSDMKGRAAALCLPGHRVGPPLHQRAAHL